MHESITEDCGIRKLHPMLGAMTLSRKVMQSKRALPVHLEYKLSTKLFRRGRHANPQVSYTMFRITGVLGAVESMDGELSAFWCSSLTALLFLACTNGITQTSTSSKAHEMIRICAMA